MSNLKFKIDVDDKELGKTVKTVKELKQALTDAQKESEDLDIGGDAFKEAQKRIKELRSELKDATGETQGLGGAFDVAGSQIDKMTGGAVSALSDVFNTTKKAIAGMNGLKIAIAGTGIGLLVLAVAALAQAFTRSEEGQNKFATILSRIGTITGTLLDLLADLGDLIIGVFENPQKAIKDFAGLIQTNIVNRFNGLLELIPNLGKSISLLFKGQFGEAAQVAGDAIAKVTLGVDDFTNKVQDAANKTREFIDAQIEKDRVATEAQNKLNEATRLETELIVQRAEAEAQIADLKLKARDIESFSAKERAQFIREAQELTQGLIDKETEALILKRDAILLQGTLGKNTAEANKAEAEAIAAVINIQKKGNDQQKSNLQQLNSLTSQAIAKQKELANAAKKYDDERQAAARQIEDQELGLRSGELEREQARFDALIEQTLNNTALQEGERQRLLVEFNQEKLRLEDEQIEAEIEQNRIKYSRLIQDTLDNELLLESEKQALIKGFEEQRALEESSAREELVQERIAAELKAESDKQEALKEFEAFVREELAEEANTRFEQELIEQEEKYARQLEKLEDFLERGIITREEYNNRVKDAERINAREITEIEIKEAQRRAEETAKINQLRIGAVQNVLGSISSLVELFSGKSRAQAKRAFEIQKKVSIAQALVDTYSSAAAAFKAAMITGGPIGPILAPIAAIAATTAGLANVKQIRSQKFESPSESSTPTAPTESTLPSTTGGPSTPQFNLFGTGGSSEITGAPQPQDSPPQVIRAYVSESDITDTGRRLSNIRQQSEL